MANIPLSRSEVFGELRKELHDDKEFHESDAHIFIIMGASVRAGERSHNLCLWSVKIGADNGMYSYEI